MITKCYIVENNEMLLSVLYDIVDNISCTVELDSFDEDYSAITISCYPDDIRMVEDYLAPYV